jgi:hypothetical protein
MGTINSSYRLIIDRVIVANKIYTGLVNARTPLKKDGQVVMTSQCIKLEQEYYGLTSMERGPDYLCYNAQSLSDDSYSIRLFMRKTTLPVTGPPDPEFELRDLPSIYYEVTEYPTQQVLDSGYINPMLQKWYKPIGGPDVFELDVIGDFFK